jgi:preprotein translocase subunit SecG
MSNRGDAEAGGAAIAFIIIVIAIICAVILVCTLGTIIGALFGGGTAVSNYHKSFKNNVAFR